MRISELELYEALRSKMDEKEARSIVEYIGSKVEMKFEQAQTIFATKEDLLKLELKIVQLIADTKAETMSLFADTHKLIAEAKADTIKWMFAFVFASTISIIGVIITIMKMGGWGN
jgi:hypothetical protein